MKWPLPRALCLAIGLGMGFPLLAAPVSAQDAKPTRAKKVRAKRESKRAHAEARSPASSDRRHHRRAKKEKESAQAPAQTHGPEATPSAAPSAAAQAAQAAAAGVNSQIVQEGSTNVKMMEFTGLGIDGRLRSPQLVYFVQRVRAEFDRPELPHRSFIPELEASSGREPVR